MKILVKYIHNTQAVEVNGDRSLIAFHNQRQFDYQNKLGNKVIVRQQTPESRDAERGQY